VSEAKDQTISGYPAALLVGLISGAVALAAAGIAVWGQFKIARFAAQQKVEERKVDTEKTMSRYREPLARAAYDLQSRLYNILKQGLITVYFDNGDKRERAYVIDNTAF
jgi:hypothetical protein